jgi:predicted Fe-S protein YdhL (DUF1289 family)
LPPKLPTEAPAPVPSPCISVCRIDAASGLCVGCLRTLDEIAAWSGLDDDARRAVWRAIATRKAGGCDVSATGPPTT